MKMETNRAQEILALHKRGCRPGPLTSVLFSFCLLAAGVVHSTVQAQGTPRQPTFRHDRILAKPKAGVDLGVWNSLVGTRALHTYPRMGNLQAIQLPPGAWVADFVAIYQQSGLVEYAEPDYLIRIVATPNDVRFADGSLWGLHNTGQLGGKPDADIDAPEAWDTLSSAQNIIVAVIDTGIRATHEDLAGNLWINPGETGRDFLGLDKSANLLDDDGNGYIDDLHGIDAILGIGMPFDDHGHGTHVAGTIGALGGNGAGVVGVAWRVQLMACKFLNALGQGFTSDAIECIDYARTKGATLINASWGGYDTASAALRDAIASARDAGIIFVAAAGNDATDNDTRPLFPASYDLDNIIAVAATDRRDERAFFSNFGARTVDLGAPGHEIFSCWNLSDNDYRAISGTSMATPHVVGACALVWAKYPGENFRQIINRVLGSVDPVPGLAGKSSTGGRLNLQKALGPGGVTANFTPGSTSGTAPLSVTFTDQSTGTIVGRAWNFGDGAPPNTEASPTHVYRFPGRYVVALAVTGANGATSTRSRVISVNLAPRLSMVTASGSSPSGTTSPLGRHDAGGDNDQFVLEGEPDSNYLIQASSDLATWVTIATNRTASGGTVLLTDPRAGRFARRFYRAILQGTETPAALGYRSDRLLVKPKTGLNLSVPNLLLGASVLRSFPHLGHLQVVKLPEGKSVQEAIAHYQQSGQVEYAEPDGVVHVLATPDDFRFGDGTLWGLHNTGQLGGSADADIDAPEAWDIRTAADAVIVAVIDTGIRYTHEDLAANLWRNPGEVAGNGVDDDGNGFVDDLHGINAILGNGDPHDDHGHGSHVAGTIGAVGNNQLGVVGVAWRARLMACKFITPQGDGSISDAIDCIDYARKHGAQIINASWGAPTFNSAALRDAIAAARTAGILFVAAAGNSAKDNDAEPLYPASYDLDNIIAVAATTRNDELAFFSHWGASSVDLGAPGQNIFSCWASGDSAYQYFDGTSMASAQVSGATALLRAHYPGESPQQIINRLLSGTDPLPALAGKCVTGGRLNLQKALGVTPPATTVTVSATDANAAEAGADPGEFTLTRTGSTTGALAVHFTLGGSASNGTDYQTTPTSVTLTAGSASVTVPITPLDDPATEGDETVILTLSPGAGYAVGSPGSATVILADNDALPPPPPQPTVTVTASDADAAETGPDQGEFTLTRSGATDSSLTVGYTLSGTAANGTDYETLSGSVTIAAGASSATITVRPMDDVAPEGSETVALTLNADSAYDVGSPNSATVTIADNDQPPPPPQPTVTVTASDADAAEAGPDNGEFTITRDGSTDSPLTIHFTLGGSATTGTDYQDLPTSATVPVGAASTTIRITPLDDAQAEGSETVVLTVSADAAYTVGSPGSALVTISDNDQPPPPRPVVTVIATDADAAEGGPNTGEFTLTRTGDTASALTVHFALSGSAANGTDFDHLGTTGTIPAGAAATTITVTPIDDNEVEGNETVGLTLSNDAAYDVGSPNSATVTIADNDQPPPPPRPTVTVTASDASAAEGGNDSAEFTFTRAGDTSGALTVRYSLDGTATRWLDYRRAEGDMPEFLTIPDGAASASLVIHPMDDSEVEGEETAILTLRDDDAYVVGSPNSATVAIADNDQAPPPPPTVTTTASDADAAEAGPNNGAIIITRTGDTDSALTVHFTISGSAANGTDFNHLGTTGTIPAGAASTTITITPIDDNEVEGAETVVLTLSADAAYDVGSPNSAMVTIADNDQPPPPRPTVTVTASDADAAEAGPDDGQFRITRAGDTSASLTVRYSVNGTASNGTDCESLSGSATMAAGSSAVTVTVRPADDSEVEGSETVVLTLSNDAAYDVGSPNSATVTIADNDQPPPPPRPTVIVAATIPLAAELLSVPGEFTFTRAGDTGQPLTVRYTIGGDATNGTDYQAIPSSVTIPAGALFATVRIVPINDTAVEGNEAVFVIIAPHASYEVGVADRATVQIVDDDPPLPILLESER